MKITITQFIKTPRGFDTPSANRAGKLRALWNTYIWTPSLPKGGWGKRPPTPKDYKEWKSLDAQRAFTVLTTPGKRFNSTTEKALFSSLESKKVKPFHSLYDRGNLSFEEATTNLETHLPQCIESLNADLKEGQEGFIPIPVTTPKAEISSLSKPWQAGLIAWRALSIALVLPWLALLIKQCIPKYRGNWKTDADWLWTPGAGHISLILVPVKKQGEQLHVGEYEYFDSKGLPIDHPENRLVKGEKEAYVKDLIPAINTILSNNHVVIPKFPTMSHSTYQFQTDTHNCGYWVYRYTLLRTQPCILRNHQGLPPGMTLDCLKEFSKTIDLQRQLFDQSSLRSFLPNYVPPQTSETSAEDKKLGDDFLNVSTKNIVEEDWVS